jgi:17beta-estradiol 17-dehydrogenase / 3alpha(17beta)-hydroxysteroid dehydrogenase (NAD+) / 3-oxoacyl-[acyl-carrier protein] reductase alpha subunit
VFTIARGRGRGRHSFMLKNSVAIVTGAASGIGRATAAALAARGARVAAVDLNPCAADVPCEASFECNVAKPGAATQLLLDVETQFGEKPTVLVNSAGITRDGWLWKLPEEDWDAVLDVNLKAPFLLTQAFARCYMENGASAGGTGAGRGGGGGAAVINISSIIAKVGNMGQSNYAASKAGLIGLTKSSAKDLAQSGIRVNAILPGFIETPMALAVPNKVLDSFKSQIPLGQLGKPEDIAEAAVFLAEAEYITGATLEVTGGLYM